MSSTAPTNVSPSPMSFFFSTLRATSGRMVLSILPASSRALTPWSSQCVFATCRISPVVLDDSETIVAIRGWD